MVDWIPRWPDTEWSPLRRVGYSDGSANNNAGAVVTHDVLGRAGDIALALILGLIVIGLVIGILWGLWKDAR